jgi:hypothetical protein
VNQCHRSESEEPWVDPENPLVLLSKEENMDELAAHNGWDGRHESTAKGTHVS